MSLRAKLLEVSKGFPARFEEQRDGSLSLEFKVAERKVFLSKKKLMYRCRLRINDEEKTVTYFETLKETGAGISGDMDMGISPGYGFKKETYKITGKEREGSIEELSRLFGKDYKYSFDYSAIRDAVKKEVQNAGYAFIVRLSERSI
ncbi:MAG: ribonucleoside-triphosphate reductase [Candidatus Bathyarchaeia archaeon]